MQKPIKWGLLGLGSLLCLAILIYGGVRVLGDADLAAATLFCDTAPGDDYAVLVEQCGDPVWPFGPVTVHITVQHTQTNKVVARFREDVMNDGAGLYASQFEIEWHHDTVRITIDPAEADDIVHEIPLIEP